jgi:hypothetical protein
MAARGISELGPLRKCVLQESPVYISRCAHVGCACADLLVLSTVDVLQGLTRCHTWATLAPALPSWLSQRQHTPNGCVVLYYPVSGVSGICFLGAAVWHAY